MQTKVLDIHILLTNARLCEPQALAATSAELLETHIDLYGQNLSLLVVNDEIQAVVHTADVVIFIRNNRKKVDVPKGVHICKFESFRSCLEAALDKKRPKAT